MAYLIYFGNLPVNWPKLLRPFQNGFATFFICMYVFGMSVCITSAKKKADIIFQNGVLDQFNAVDSK